MGIVTVQTVQCLLHFLFLFITSLPSFKSLISGFPVGCPAEGVGGVGGQRDVPAVPRHRAAEAGHHRQALEHYRDTQCPLQGELDHDGQCGDHQVPERDDSVNKTRAESRGGQAPGQLQPQQGSGRYEMGDLKLSVEASHSLENFIVPYCFLLPMIND